MAKRVAHPLTLAFLIIASATLAACSKPPETVLTAPALPSSPSANAYASGASNVGATSANVSDVDVTEHVQTALRQAPSLLGTDIAVVTQKGDVRLTGVLNNQGQVDDALRIAAAAEGAHAVHAELTLKK